MESNPWLGLPRIWLNVELPGMQAGPEHSTYVGRRLEDLPPVPIELDDEFDWLRLHGAPHAQSGLDQPDEFVRPLPSTAVCDLAAQIGVKLPSDFVRFMTSTELQSFVRSCTACYLDPGERAVETIGAIPGFLFHFLSDSQSCAHWYLHVIPSGQSVVLESDDLYGYRIENSDWMDNPACRLERIDVAGLDFRVCASSFSEFLFRFWIENEIWYGLKVEANQRRLSALESTYLGGCKTTLD
jgi:hypothetical protein